MYRFGHAISACIPIKKIFLSARPQRFHDPSTGFAHLQKTQKTQKTSSGSKHFGLAIVVGAGGDMARQSSETPAQKGGRSASGFPVMRR
jgi:hypothetical protein